MRPFIVGTAGHIDHGKSTLVQALTGIDPDRLPEEKRRGITIDLGFAHGALGGGVEAAFVDVPGHERFVRAMVAGAQGVDLVLLVVAADEGVMAQSREHADICQLLNLPRAVVALTKADLLDRLDPEWGALVEEDVRGLGPLFQAAPVVRVSARTGAGLDELRRTLAEAARSLASRPEAAPAFLPIDRAFSVRGHGTVVTGTLLAGAIAVEESVDLTVPAPRQARVLGGRRVRGVQVHGQPVARAVAGQRVAVNVAAEVAEVPRGTVLGAAGSGQARQGCLLDVELSVLPGAPPVPNQARLTLHLGTAQALASVELLGRPEALAGTSTLAQLRLDRALPALRDQRFVLRGFRSLSHGGRTVAGGRVLLTDRRRRRARDRSLVEALANPVSGATALLREAGARGVDAAWLALALGLPSLPKTAAVASGRAFDPAAVAKAPAAPAPLDPRAGRVESMLAAAKLTPPTAAEIAAALGIDRAVAVSVLRQLAKSGRAVRLADELFLHPQAAEDFRRRIVEALRAKGALTTLEIKEISGASRKFAIPLAEWLDRERITLRVGEAGAARASRQLSAKNAIVGAGSSSPAAAPRG